MRIHHLNCGTLAPPFPPVQAVIYCLLLETDHGLVLIDSGLGRRDCKSPNRKMRIFMWATGAKMDVEETAYHQVQALGHSPEDVRDIVLTHLHLDHAGGLPDFPRARVHVYQREYEAAMRQKGILSWPFESKNWAHGPNWVVHRLGEERWFGFRGIKIWEERGPELWLIPLHGHSPGHCGVAVRDEESWLLHCGDAASPYHPASDVHNGDGDQYSFTLLPDRMVYRFLGPHAPALRQLLQEHGDEIQAISSHDLPSFRAHVEQ